MQYHIFKIVFSLLLYFTVTISYSFSQNRFSNDAVLRKIYGFEYERNSDSLKLYFNSEVPKYKYAAIQGMASVQDTSIAPQLLQMLSTEKVDSVKLAIIYSLSQLDCYTSYLGILKYEASLVPSSIKWASLEAIGKLCKDDVTVIFNKRFTSTSKPDQAFISHWLKGLYLAKRRKHIDLNSGEENIESCLNKIKDQDLGKPDEVNYYYSKLIANTTAAYPEEIKINAKNKQEIDKKLQLIHNPYQKLNSLNKYNLSYEICKAFIFSNEHVLIKSYALDYFLSNHTWNNQINAAFIQSIFDFMDVALISRMCEYITEQKQQNKSIEVSVDMLQNTQRQLFLPRDFETWIDLEKAILSFEGKTYQYKSCFETGYKNPIDWTYIVKIAEHQKVKITTNKGAMVLMLKVNEAPGSVANFLKLVDEGYYNGKYFHRMVPNFVVQGGCPRGDGWGSLDWNQRSELSGNLKYKKGSVGLASVGKDSEGVQFFISHTFAPHLEGRYTIFAEVMNGLDIIGNLVVGDEIIAIERIKE